MFRRFWLCAALLAVSTPALSEVDEDELGAWYMVFFNGKIGDGPWGFQGDIQYRNWDLLGDLEQLLIRGGATWSPESSNALFTLGYASITSGAYGDSSATTHENRIYQEALLPQKVGNRTHLRHRFRYEQRWVEDQDFRTRFRYALFMDIPLNQLDLSQGAWYLSFYNEIFLNGERDIGDGREVEIFDRNRTYGAVGYSLTDTLRVQGGYMWQYTDDVKKGQLQLSLHQAF